MSFANKFGSFKAAVEEAAGDQAVPVAPKKAEKVMGHGREKKVVVKAKVAPVADQSKVEEGGFSTDKPVFEAKRGGNRPRGEGRGGDRGGRGGERGVDRPRTGRGGRGGPRPEGGEDRPQTEGGRGRGDRNRGGDRARGEGRGRGARPRYDRTNQVEGAEGADGAPAHHGRGEKTEHGYQGKPREQWHPMDRVSGTGAGKKDQRKGGNRAGGAGEDKNAPVVEGEEPKKEENAAEGEEKKEEPEAVVEEEKVEEPEEEDEEALPGIDFADWEAKRKLEKETGILAVKKQREHVDNPKDRVLDEQVSYDGIIKGKTNLLGSEMFAIKAGTGAEFLGFASAGPEDEVEFQSGPRDRRGGRGGRGGDRAGAGRGGRGQQEQRGGR